MGTLGWRITGSSSAATANTACVAFAGYTGPAGGPAVACGVGTVKAASGAAACTLCSVNSGTTGTGSIAVDSCISSSTGADVDTSTRVKTSLQGDGIWASIQSNRAAFTAGFVKDAARIIGIEERHITNVQFSQAPTIKLMGKALVTVQFDISNDASQSKTAVELGNAFSAAVIAGSATFTATEAASGVKMVAVSPKSTSEANDSQPKSKAAGAPAAADDADKKEADSAAVESSPAAVETKQDSTPQIGMIIALVVAAFCLVLWSGCRLARANKS